MPTYTEEEPRGIRFEELELFLPEVLKLYFPEVLELFVVWSLGAAVGKRSETA